MKAESSALLVHPAELLVCSSAIFWAPQVRSLQAPLFQVAICEQYGLQSVGVIWAWTRDCSLVSFLAVAVICSYLWPQNITCTWNSGFLPSPALISILGMETLYLYVHQCSFFMGWHVAPRWLSHAVLAQSHPDLQWSNIPWSWCQQSGKWEPLAGNVFVLRLAFNLLLRRQCLILLLLKDNQLKHKDFYSVVDVSCV